MDLKQDVTDLLISGGLSQDFAIELATENWLK